MRRFRIAAHVLGMPTIILALASCNTVSGPVENRAPGVGVDLGPTPPEIRCSTMPGKDAQPVVRLEIRNTGTETIHILADRGMPYQLAGDSNNLTILQGLNKPEPNAIYEMIGIPPTRPLAPGKGLAWNVPVGEKILQDHYLRRPAPASLLHGTIHVRCEVGWGVKPVRPDEMTLDNVLSWQRLQGYGPFDVVLP
jgi:hypothetical protein